MAGLHTYTAVCMCQPESFSVLKGTWDSIFMNVDALFIADNHQSGTRLGINHMFLF